MIWPSNGIPVTSFAAKYTVCIIRNPMSKCIVFCFTQKTTTFFFFFTVRLKSSEATDVEVSENEMQTLNEKGDGHVFKTFQIDYNYYYYYHYLWIGFNRTTSRICIGFISVKLFHTVVWLSDACSCHWTIFIIPDPFEHFTLNCSLYCM